MKKDQKTRNANVRVCLDELESCVFNINEFKSISEIRGVVSYLKKKYGKSTSIHLEITASKLIKFKT